MLTYLQVLTLVFGWASMCYVECMMGWKFSCVRISYPKSRQGEPRRPNLPSLVALTLQRPRPSLERATPILAIANAMHADVNPYPFFERFVVVMA